MSVDCYSSFPRRSQHVRALRRCARWGKPIAIAEFGTCGYEGAPRRGGLAWDVLDNSGQRLKHRLVRSERTQARHLVELVRIFEFLGLDSASVYLFVAPDAPHRHQPRRDRDLASYGIVKPIWVTHDRPTPGWHWEPKQAFRALAHQHAQRLARAAGLEQVRVEQARYSNQLAALSCPRRPDREALTA